MYFLKLKIIILLVVFFLFSGCVSVPNAPPQLTSFSNAVKFEDSYGSLTLEQNHEILDELKRHTTFTNIFHKHLPLEDELADQPLITGNKVELLVDGPATYASMIQAIENANDHINLEIFNFDDDEIGKHFADLLIDKQHRGIQVNIIYDSYGSINTPKEFFKKMENIGINVLEYNPVNPLYLRERWNINRRDHRKLLIIDGNISFVGGINISSVYSSGSFGRRSRVDNKKKQPWRDTHLRIAGPVVKEFQKLFMATWYEQRGKELIPKNYFSHSLEKGDEIIRAISSKPEMSYSPIHSILISAINQSKSQVYVTNAYFVPDSYLMNSLKNAAQRGVDVRLLLPEKTDSLMVYYASRSYYEELLNAGVKIYSRQDALLHAKTALVDGVWSTIGSTNLDWRSLYNNHELNAVIIGKDFGSELISLFKKDLEVSKLITLEDWNERSLGERLKEKIANLWAKWL